MKTCSRCKESLPFDSFNKAKSRKDGLQNICRECWKAYYRAYYQQGNEKSRLERKRKHDREVFREYIRSVKEQPCADCKKQYPYYVMQFDHRNPSEKAFTIANSAPLHSLNKIKAEIEKCDVVCANCHAERTHLQRLSAV